MLTNFFPFHEWVRRFYSGPLLFLINQIFPIGLAPLRFFSRRSSAQKDLHFNVFFSDLDLGIEVKDETTDETIQKINIRFHKWRKILFFLGELEIYRTKELKLVKELLIQSQGLYDRTRDLRKINWIKIKLRYKDRSLYHRIKDHRALKILKKKYNFKSVHNCAFNSYPHLVQITGTDENTITLPNLDRLPREFHCDYFCQRILLAGASEVQKRIFVLASMPPHLKSDKELEALFAQVRFENSELKKVFDTLNGIEFLVAQAAIRGYKKNEKWHDQWLKKLIYGAVHADKGSLGYL